MLYYILFSQNLTAEEAVIYFLITTFIFMFSITIHEFAHAFAAVKCGDLTPKLAGRLSINPFKHLDLKGFIIFMLLGVGWAKPVPINPLNFKKYKKGTRIVSISGVLSNFIFGLVAAIICAILFATNVQNVGAVSYVYDILVYIMMINSFLFMFNILPIYPLDGFNFIASFAKGENKFIKFSIKNGFKILIAILLISLLTDLLFGFDILSLIHNFVYLPIVSLGV